MELRPTGGIFARLDSSGNLTFYNTVGVELAKFVGGNFAGSFNLAQNKLLTTIATSSTTDLSTGFGASITPRISGKILILARGTLSNNTAGGLTRANLYRTTTGIPADDAATTGTQISALTLTEPTANALWRLTHALIDTGLVNGTTYSFYLAKSVGVGTETGTITGAAAGTSTQIQVMEI